MGSYVGRQHFRSYCIFSGWSGLPTTFLGFKEKIQLHHAPAILSHPTEDFYWLARWSMNW